MIGIVGKNEQDCEHYKKVVGEGAQVQIFYGLDSLRRNHQNQAFSGFIVDTRAIVNGSPEEKEFFSELEDTFAVLRVNMNPVNMRCTGVIANRTMNETEAFSYFLEQIKAVKTKTLRKRRRRPVFLNLLVTYLDQNGKAIPGKESMKLNTSDASDEGLFVVTMDTIAEGARVKLVIQDFQEKAPIEAEVRWVLPWGHTPYHLPGFGVLVTKMLKSQKEELYRCLSRTPKD